MRKSRRRKSLLISCEGEESATNGRNGLGLGGARGKRTYHKEPRMPESISQGACEGVTDVEGVESS